MPTYFDYWGGKTVGTSGIADNCPLANAYSNRHCADPDMGNQYYSGSSGWTSDSTVIPAFYGKYGVCVLNSAV